jgi:hypothetical protein
MLTARSDNWRLEVHAGTHTDVVNSRSRRDWEDQKRALLHAWPAAVGSPPGSSLRAQFTGLLQRSIAEASHPAAGLREHYKISNL